MQPVPIHHRILDGTILDEILCMEVEDGVQRHARFGWMVYEGVTFVVEAAFAGVVGSTCGFELGVDASPIVLAVVGEWTGAGVLLVWGLLVR